MQRIPETQAAGAAVCKMLNDLLAAGHDEQHIANALFGYSLRILEDVHGREQVAKHLITTAMKFADKKRDMWGGGAANH